MDVSGAVSIRPKLAFHQAPRWRWVFSVRGMLRVNSSNVLVVPPWECAWLSDEQLQLQNGAGCICFDVKGEFRYALLTLGLW